MDAEDARDTQYFEASVVAFQVSAALNAIERSLNCDTFCMVLIFLCSRMSHCATVGSNLLKML